MNDRLHQLQLTLSLAVQELSSAIAMGENRCGSGAIMQPVHDALQYVSLALNLVDQVQRQLQDAMMRDNVQEALRFGREL